jgi:hypothetical protein
VVYLLVKSLPRYQCHSRGSGSSRIPSVVWNRTGFLRCVAPNDCLLQEYRGKTDGWTGQGIVRALCHLVSSQFLGLANSWPYCLQANRNPLISMIFCVGRARCILTSRTKGIVIGGWWTTGESPSLLHCPFVAGSSWPKLRMSTISSPLPALSECAHMSWGRTTFVCLETRNAGKTRGRSSI